MTLIEETSPLRHRAYAGPPAGLKWPKETEAVIAKYEKAWDEYDSALLKLQDAEGELSAAEVADTLALIEAVRIEAPDPGPANATVARRALEYAGERLLQKYTALGIAQEAMVKQVKAEHGDVVAQAARIERDLLARLEAAHTEATAIMDKANAEFQSFGDAINGLEALGLVTAEGYIFGYSLSAPGFNIPVFNRGDYNAALQRLDYIDGDIDGSNLLVRGIPLD